MAAPRRLAASALVCSRWAVVVRVLRAPRLPDCTPLPDLAQQGGALVGILTTYAFYRLMGLIQPVVSFFFRAARTFFLA